MVLIDEINGVKFYDGMDYDYALNYNKEELIVFFIKDIESVLDNKKKSKKRNDVIDSLLGNIDKEDIASNISNNVIETKPIPQNTQTAKVPKSKKASLKDSPFSKFRVILPTLMKIFTAKYQKKCQ